MRSARLGDVAVSMKNGLYKPATEYGDDGTPCLRMYNIDAGSIVWRDIKRMRISAAEFEDYRLREGDLLVNRVNSRELVGKAAYIPASLEPSVFESKNIRVRLDTSKVLPKFINYQLLAGSRRYFAGNAQQVVGMASISQQQLADFPIVMADLAAQHCIVAELEKQFSRLDEAVANLKRVKANLRNLRASALNSACEGPWPSIEFGLLARDTLVGLDRGRDQQRSVGPGHRYVKMNNVSMDGEIQLEGIVYVDASSQEATRYALRSGDILFNTRNSVELVGKSALVPPELEGALYNNNLMRIRTTPEIDSAFLAMQMCTPAFRRQLEKVKRATTSVAAIYLKDLVRLPVIVPPVTEQCRIVAEVDRRLSIVRGVEAEVDANLMRAQALRQSVLACQLSVL
jgi:type I restriction enzyme S subunit